MVEKTKIYDNTRLITWLCYVTVILSLISLRLEHSKAGIIWNTKLPEWTVFILWSFSFASVLLLLKDYIQISYQKSITSLTIVAVIFFVLGPLNAIGESSLNDGVMVLVIILLLVYPVFVLISGIQINKIEEERKIGALLIIYAVLIIISIFVSTYFILINNFPIWFYSVSTVVDISFLLILSRKFRKMAYNKRKSEIQQ
ncbi:MAG: hypothetical protein PHP31_07020 [Lentimicrobiaceae bacterium]|nr:hypothetical protein [Lentimicrobiaceae bacterium]